mmetsp:Transcript_23052/g.51179  ORF Transcript_23052/g.51179 Transcript_23052/m.51179 type:complete len:208 (-) Transcript_23052:85-708(-)
MHKRKDGLNVAHLLVDHKAKDAHLSCSAVVELDGALLVLPVVGLLVPTEVEGAVAEVALELRLPVGGDSGSLALVAVGGLHEGPGGDHLSPDHAGNGRNGIKTGGNVLGTRETNTGSGGEVSNDGKHGNTAVLELNPTEVFEALLALTVEVSHRIEEAKRRLDAKLLVERGRKGGGRGGLGGGGGEGGGAGNEGGNNSELHLCLIFC